MRFLLRPVLSVLLVVLVALWGVCPCVSAQMLGIESATCGPKSAEGPAAGARQGTCCLKACCGKRRASDDAASSRSPASQPMVEGPAVQPTNEDGCPCCERGEWMRDLPPQGPMIALDAPTLTAFDLPHLVLAEPSPDMARETIWTDIGPPPACKRPHAAPVGIVLLLN